MLTLDSKVSDLIAEPTLSFYARAEIQALLRPPPVQVQASSDGTIAAMALRAGFSNCLVSFWEWGHADKITIDTAALGGIGPNGILVVPFVPNFPEDDNNLAMISATGYPAPNMGNTLTVCLSDKPCVLYETEPATATDTSPTVVYGVGSVRRASWWSNSLQGVALTPGRTYYINVAGREGVTAVSPYGIATAVPGRMGYPNCDIRLEAQKPQGH